MNNLYYLIKKSFFVCLFCQFLTTISIASELRVEWFNSVCPKGIPVQAIEETPQKMALLAASVLTAVAPKLISSGVDLFAKKLQEAGVDKPDNMYAKSDTFFYTYLRERRNSISARCLIVVEAEAFNENSVVAEQDRWRRSAPIVGGYKNPRLIFMAAVEPAIEGKLFRLVPVFLEIGEWRNTTVFSGATRNYSINVGMSSIDSTNPFAKVTFSFENLSEKTVYTSESSVLDSRKSDFVSLPVISAEGTKYINSFEAAWVSKDRAASILNANATRIKEAALIEKPAGKEPSLYSNAEFRDSLDEYCKTVTEFNKQIEISKREIPGDCNWRIQMALLKLASAKISAELSPESLVWAAKTCWHDSQERESALKNPVPTGYRCSTPISLISEKSKPHTRVFTSVIVTEVIPGSRIAKFIGDAILESKTEVSKAIGDALPPLTNQAKILEDATDRALRQDIVESEFKVTLAQNELDELSSASPASKFTDKRMKLQAAWYTANKAYLKAGRFPPYPEID